MTLIAPLVTLKRTSQSHPYGDTYGDLMKWAEEQADEDLETERAADRAAEEGMIDREEEQVTRAEEARMDAELDNGESV